ncbi:MAG: efflux RND transporter periplasmic adaptor subunit [Phycisphaerales bacterium JB063]
MPQHRTGIRLGLSGLFLLGLLAAAPGALHGQAGRSQPRVSDGATMLSQYEGFAEPSREVVLGAPLDGVLAALPVREGQRVTRDDVLAVMDDRVQQLVVEIAWLESQSRAAIDAAQAALDEATLEWENQVDLERRGSATERDVRRALASQKQAQAELTRATEQADIAVKQHELEQQRLERYTLRAPFDGQVVTIETDEGAALRQNDPVLLLVNTASLKAVINLPEELQRGGRLELGRTYRLERLDKDHRVIEELQGELLNIDSVSDRGSQTIRFTFGVENPDGTTPAGFLFRVASLEAVGAGEAE